MEIREIRKLKNLRGELSIPGDKSISHRSVMFGALAEGTTKITNFLEGADCLSTIDCFRKMGVEIQRRPEEILVHGKGLHGLCAPTGTLFLGNSGTTTRLLSGILAGQSFSTELTGDESLCSRPMKRIISPLTRMGAQVQSLYGNDCLPMRISGKPLTGIHYSSPVASAQVKSCVLLAGMYADRETSVTEPVLSRDHTERMLRFFGADVKSEGTTASILPEPELCAREIQVPGDISSAAYFLAAGLLVPGSEILLKNVGINPTRDGILRVIRDMGGDVTLLHVRQDGEPTADLLVRASALHGTTVQGSIIPTLIDELPMIAVLAAFAQGTTVIRDAAELRVKESDRIAVMTENLKRMGADIEATQDGMIIRGGRPLHGAEIDSHLDHRVAMSFAVAGTVCDGMLTIRDSQCVDISYPQFYRDLYSLQPGLKE
ncbi:MAG: 3-phosphoshikimate 1-carboxyvinyltransferase [Clostridiales bacterium]|nr:3-phosphoshikimate 1-carboxyvinyltransferase [Clostridiales bacterium]